MSNEYADFDYADYGYFFTPRQFIFTYGASSVELPGPSSRSGQVRLVQPEEFSCGWVRYGYAPLVTLHTLTLDYSRLRQDEADGLTAFRVAVDDTANRFDYVNGETGDAIPCWFADQEQALENSAYNLYRGRVALIGTTPFIPFPGAPPADLDAILANAQYPYKQAIQRRQPRRWMTDGTPRVTNKSAIKRVIHGLALRRKSAADLGGLLSHFVNTAVGIKNKWTWTDNGTPRQVRFAESAIDWRQSPFNTQLYDVDLMLEEDT